MVNKFNPGPLLNGAMVLQAIQAYRLVWITGRFGGGKTSFAYRIFSHFGEMGYRLISNNYSAWNDEYKDIQLNPETGHLRSVVILDEGGQYFTSSQQIKMIASYAAKMDVIYLIPSFFPPATAAQVVTIQPLWSLIGVGIPMIFYKWAVRLGTFRESSWFAWINPNAIYGIYSRQDPGDRAEDITVWLIEKSEEFRSFHKRGGDTKKSDYILKMESTSEEIFSDSVDDLARTVDAMASISQRKNNRRRF